MLDVEVVSTWLLFTDIVLQLFLIIFLFAQLQCCHISSVYLKINIQNITQYKSSHLKILSK